MHVKIERVYDAADAVDGFRILVDRLWPRDLTKVHATVDLGCGTLRRAQSCVGGSVTI
jgi:uncharacterized protein YeaO (DUF488 family)